jgi:flagellar biosynthesis regulator FlbT
VKLYLDVPQHILVLCQDQRPAQVCNTPLLINIFINLVILQNTKKIHTHVTSQNYFKCYYCIVQDTMFHGLMQISENMNCSFNL